MRKILFTILLLAASATAMAAINGDWHGRLDVMGSKLTLVIHIDADSVATLDSPDQGAKGIPAVVAFNAADSLAVAVEPIGLLYTARLSADGASLRGTFSQNGLTLPLDMERGLPARRRPQTPQPPFPYSTRELTFSNPADGATLAGTLTLPDNPRPDMPLVVMVSGSGQQDRDEQIFEHKPFAVIADYLARNGIASFRYDDRGIGASDGLRPDLTTADFKADALAALEMLRAEGIARRIGILGHSEGGLIAFMIAGDNPGTVDFIATMAGSALRGDAILLSQMMRMSGRLGQALNPVEAMTAIARQADATPWIGYFVAFDPAPSIRRIACPVFAANGTLDTQVDADANLAAIRANLKAKPSDTIKAYPGLNHLFQHARTGFVDEYADIEETVAPEFLADLAEWLKNLN